MIRFAEKIFTYKNFLIINGLLAIAYMFIFKPVIEGDAGAYIAYARQIFNLQDASVYDFTHRSPLYPMLLGLIMKLAGESGFLNIIVILQYGLVFIVSVLVYNIFKIVSGSQTVGFIAGLLSTLNLSTVYFAYNILSESLAIFLFTSMVLTLMKHYQSGRIVYIAIAGLLTGMLILTRFNTIGLPFVICITIVVIHFFLLKSKTVSHLLKQLLVFSGCYLMIIGLWSFYNLSNNGFFGVIPPYHKGQRWAIPSIINEKTTVSAENQGILNVFLKAKRELDAENPVPVYKKGTLLHNRTINSIVKYFEPENNGFYLYTSAEPDLFYYFNLQPLPSDRIKLWEKLKPFYSEVARNGRAELFRLRMFSFLHTFKYVSPSQPEDQNRNLNKLPALIFIAYKICFLFISIVVFIFSFFHSLYILAKSHKESLYLLILYFAIWYFPLIHFYANVLNDANRFKYPAESIITGIFVFLLFQIFTHTNFYNRHERRRGSEERI